jgi:hypothetical protein
MDFTHQLPIKQNKTGKGSNMKNTPIELTKSYAQAVTRRAALKKYAVGLALGCALLGLTVRVRAGDQVPFNGNFNPVILLATPVDESHVHLDLHVTARATHLGNAQGAASIILNVTDLTYVGHTIWVASNGDSVALTFEGQFVPTSTPGVLQNVETFEVVGGTGRFKGATGAGVASGLLDAATLVPLKGTVPFVGTISSPGSLKK